MLKQDKPKLKLMHILWHIIAIKDVSHNNWLQIDILVDDNVNTK